MDNPGNAAITKGSNEGNDNTSSTQEVNWEKRFKDTQSAFTKKSQEVAALKAENEALKKSVRGNLKLDLTDRDYDDLEDLRVNDPDAWRAKLNDLENKRFEDFTKNVATETARQTEVARREELLKIYNEQNPNHQITDEVYQLDIPQRIKSKLEKNEVSFEEFLAEANSFLKRPVSIKKPDNPDLGPDLGSVGAQGSQFSGSKASTPSYEQGIY